MDSGISGDYLSPLARGKIRAGLWVTVSDQEGFITRRKQKENKDSGKKKNKKKIHLVWNIPRAIPAIFGASIPSRCQKLAFQHLCLIPKACAASLSCPSTGIECSAHPEIILGSVTCLSGHVPGEWQPPICNPNLQEAGMKVLTSFLFCHYS